MDAVHACGGRVMIGDVASKATLKLNEPQKALQALAADADGFLEVYWMEVFDAAEFDKWVQKAVAPPIESSLKLYEEVLKLGFKIVFLTGRSENQRIITVENLTNAGFQNWDKLILRMEVFDAVEFDKWVQKAVAPLIESNLKLYKKFSKLGQAYTEVNTSRLF
ncbi:Acid phosphatase, class B-like [Dillenia turbinata]|uniref:Acid phosphatase, class B-like n=1 Tax=Dillenia turbinata TaxID=194707 RepID=A0AAN8YWA9_9MAGN